MFIIRHSICFNMFSSMFFWPLDFGRQAVQRGDFLMELQTRNFNQEFSTRKLHSTSSMNFHGIGYIQQWWPNSEKHLPNRLLQSLDSNVCSNVCFNLPSNFWPKRHFVGAIAQKAPIIEDSKLVLFDNFECFEYLPGTWYADRISHEFNKKESKKNVPASIKKRVEVSSRSITWQFSITL